MLNKDAVRDQTVFEEIATTTGEKIPRSQNLRKVLNLSGAKINVIKIHEQSGALERWQNRYFRESPIDIRVHT